MYALKVAAVVAVTLFCTAAFLLLAWGYDSD